MGKVFFEVLDRVMVRITSWLHMFEGILFVSHYKNGREVHLMLLFWVTLIRTFLIACLLY